MSVSEQFEIEPPDKTFWYADSLGSWLYKNEMYRVHVHCQDDDRTYIWVLHIVKLRNLHTIKYKEFQTYNLLYEYCSENSAF